MKSQEVRGRLGSQEFVENSFSRLISRRRLEFPFTEMDKIIRGFVSLGLSQQSVTLWSKVSGYSN